MIAAVAAAVVLVVPAPPPANAAVVWDGDPAKGTGVFGNLECVKPGSIVPARQSDGTVVWRYTKARSDDRPVIRCESRGVRTDGKRHRFRNGRTYYLGWSSKFSTTTAGDYSIFQWKSYGPNGGSGNGTQNYPVILKIRNNEARLFHVAPGEEWRLIWTGEVAPWNWYRFVVGIRTSDTAAGGWVELWFNGEKQPLGPNGVERFPGRTWDTFNEPKWGVYDRAHPDLEAVHRAHRMRIGTAYGDVS
ncbi:heparin lyase I family protein [Actinosynnema sp. NPDC004786]